jgi:hypothetical protein
VCDKCTLQLAASSKRALPHLPHLLLRLHMKHLLLSVDPVRFLDLVHPRADRADTEDHDQRDGHRQRRVRRQVWLGEAGGLAERLPPQPQAAGQRRRGPPSRAQAYCLGKQLCKSEHSVLPRACTAACPYSGKHCDVWVQPMQRCLERALGEGWIGPQPKS